MNRDVWRRFAAVSFPWIIIVFQTFVGASGRSNSCLHYGCDLKDITIHPLNVTLRGKGEFSGTECQVTGGGEVVMSTQFVCSGSQFGANELTCNERREWTPSSVVCFSATECPLYNSPQNGNFWQTSSDIYSLARFGCDEGFTLIGSSTAYCRPDGTWSHPIPSCQAPPPTSCPRPDVAPTVELTPDDASYPNSSRVTFSCVAEHARLGNDSSICLNGEWFPDPAECYTLSINNVVQTPPENCLRRRLAAGSALVYKPIQTSYQPNRVVRFSCVNASYTLVGEAMSQCGARRQWTTPVPECVLTTPLRRCPAIDSSSYTRIHPISQVDFASGDVVVIECRDEATTTVCLDGEWEPQPGVCVDGASGTSTTMVTEIRESERLVMLPLNSSTAGILLRDFTSLTAVGENITAEDVGNTVTFIERFAELKSPHQNETDSMMAIVSNLMDVNSTELARAHREGNATNRALTAVSRQLEIVRTTDKTFRTVQQNLALQVVDVDPYQTADSIFFATFQDDPDDDQEEDEFLHQTRVVFNKSARYDFVNVDDFHASVSLPNVADLLKVTSRNDRNDRHRVSFVVYRKTSLFVSVSLDKLNSRGITTTKPSIPIISVIAHDMDEDTEIDDTVNTTFVVDQDTNRIKDVDCVYWDFEGNGRLGGWSSRGCSRVEGSPNSRPMCRCRRLANFAILLNVYNDNFISEEFGLFIKFLTYIACGLSTCGLVMTIYAYTSSTKLRHKQPNQILLCLCGTLLGLYVVFLLVVGIGPEIPVVACGILAGLLHYFALSSLAWMAVEGLNAFLLFVRIIDIYIARFVRKVALFAWGLPAVVVVTIGCIFRENYIRNDICFIQRLPHIIGLLAPVGIILLVNLVIFVLVMRRLSTITIGKLRNDDSSRHRERIRRLRNGAILFVLLGLTWLSGFLVNIREKTASSVFMVVFIICNAFQGFLIFLLYTLRLSIARQQLSCGCLPSRDRVAKLFRLSSSASSSSSGGDDKNKNKMTTKGDKNHPHMLSPLKLDKMGNEDSGDTVTTPE